MCPIKKNGGIKMLFHSGFGLGSFFYRFFETLVYVTPAVIIAISLHEFAHGWVSCILGDPTPKLDGRLTLNPFRHLDIWGTLCLLIFHVGWAKPIRVNTRNYKHPKRDMILVTLAGPAMNFVVAFLSLVLHGILYKIGPMGFINEYLYIFSYYSAVLNMGLGLFNLIPIPPLDGATVVKELWPAAGEFYFRMRRYSIFLIALLLGTGVLTVPLNMINHTFLNGMWTVIRVILRIGIYTGTGGSGVVI